MPNPPHLPAGEERDVLMRLYGYRFTRTGGVAGAEPQSDPADVAEAARLGWAINVVTSFTPQESYERSIEAAAVLDESAVLDGFVAGLGSWPSGRQLLVSFAWTRHLKDAARGSSGLHDCGLDRGQTGTPHDVDITERLLRVSLGWAWNEFRGEYIAELEVAAAMGSLPASTTEDRERLRALFDVIRSCPEGTPASKLEQAVARAKIIPGTDKYQRYGILIGLAEFGALPCELSPSWDRFVSIDEIAQAWRGGPRSDITPPLCGWRGGLDERKVDQLLAASAR